MYSTWYASFSKPSVVQTRKYSAIQARNKGLNRTAGLTEQNPLTAENAENAEDLARETRRTKSFYVREALLKSKDDMEDVYLADKIIERIIRKGEEKTYSMDEVEAHLGLGD